MLPREKLIKYGANTLAEYELLAIILGVGNSDENVFDLSKNILSQYQNLKELLDLSYEELIKYKGIKQAKATKIIASIEFAKRIFEYQPNKIKLDNPDVIYSLMRFELENKTHEEFFVLFLDKALRLQKKLKLASGTNDSLTVEIKDIFRTAIKYDSLNIILIHNHPSGTLTPSKSDIKTTKLIVTAAKILEINVLDHLIISANGYYSFMKNHII